jgi:hypothetical protein
MTPSFTDSSGKERTLPIAAKDLIVHDNAIGIDRQILAGQAVPGDLLEEYEAAIGGSDSEAATGGKPVGKLNLEELKAYAEEHEIELGDATTKAEIVAVIKAHEAE